MAESLDRLATGIGGFDAILGGGFVRGGAYIVQGRPGAGKTILANQTAFHHARTGGRVLYVSLLAESHTHLFQNLGTLDFFDRGLIPNGVYYINANRALGEEGLDGLVELLRGETRRLKATLLILDGLLNVRQSAGSELDLKRCLQAIQGHAEFAGCTVMMLTSAALDEVSPEHTMVDGIIELSEDVVGVRSVRRLCVRKHRGSAKLGGLHQFDITGRGIRAFPRLESRYERPSAEDVFDASRVPTGIGPLDGMLGGGLPSRSTTLLLGASGTGKTMLGLGFLAGSTPGEPGLHFGFYETPPRLAAKAAAIGVDLGALTRAGAVEVAWQPETESLLDAVGERLLDAVDRRGVRRLFIDGLGGFRNAAVEPARFMGFTTALLNELRVRGVTTLASWEVPRIIGGGVDAPATELSSIVENMLLLRFAEVRASVHRLLAVMKVRDSAYDPGIREFRIGARGIELDATHENSEALLGGFPRPAGP